MNARHPFSYKNFTFSTDNQVNHSSNSQVKNRIETSEEKSPMKGLENGNNQFISRNENEDEIICIDDGEENVSNPKRVFNVDLNPISENIQLSEHQTRTPFQELIKDNLIKNNLYPFIPIISKKHHYISPIPESILNYQTEVCINPEKFKLKDMKALLNEEISKYKCPNPYIKEINKLGHESFLNIKEEIVSRKDLTVYFVNDSITFDTCLSTLQKVKIIGVNLIIDQENSYYGSILFLVIITLNECFLLDITILQNQAAKLNQIFDDPKILKVMLDCKDKIVFLQKDLGIYTLQLFDIQDGIKMLNLNCINLNEIIVQILKSNSCKPIYSEGMNKLLKENENSYLEPFIRSSVTLLEIYSELRAKIASNKFLGINKLKECFEKSKDYCSKVFVKSNFRNAKEYINLKSMTKPQQGLLQHKIYKMFLKYRDFIAKKEDLPVNKVISIQEINIFLRNSDDESKIDAMFENKNYLLKENIDSYVSLLKVKIKEKKEKSGNEPGFIYSETINESASKQFCGIEINLKNDDHSFKAFINNEEEKDEQKIPIQAKIEKKNNLSFTTNIEETNKIKDVDQRKNTININAKNRIPILNEEKKGNTENSQINLIQTINNHNYSLNVPHSRESSNQGTQRANSGKDPRDIPKLENIFKIKEDQTPNINKNNNKSKNLGNANEINIIPKLPLSSASRFSFVNMNSYNALKNGSEMFFYESSSFIDNLNSNSVEEFNKILDANILSDHRKNRVISNIETITKVYTVPNKSDLLIYLNPDKQFEQFFPKPQNLKFQNFQIVSSENPKSPNMIPYTRKKRDNPEGINATKANSIPSQAQKIDANPLSGNDTVIFEDDEFKSNKRKRKLI